MKIGAVQDWSRDRDLHTTDRPEVQFIKLIEEIGELSAAVFPDEFMDAIGDSVVVMIIIAQQNGIDFHDIYKQVSYSVDPQAKMKDVEAEAFAEINTSLGQLARAYCREDTPDLEPTLVDITSALAKIGYKRGVSLIGALDFAYDNIRDRKGSRNSSGIYVKYDS